MNLCGQVMKINMFQYLSVLITVIMLVQVVTMNPYAALCSKMLSQAINKLKTGDN